MTAKSRTAWTLAVTSAALFMASLDNLVVTTALPSIREHLHASLQGLQWTVNAYTLTFAVLLLTGASLGERYGRRRMFVDRPGRVHRSGRRPPRSRPASAGSIAARAVQGVGGGHRRPADPHDPVGGGAPAAPRHGPGHLGRGRRPGHRHRPAGRRRRRRGRVVAVDLLAERADRHRAAAARPGPAHREPRAGRPAWTCPASCWPAWACSGIVYGVVRGNDHGWTSATVLAPIVVGALLVAGFVAWELRARQPMLPMHLFRSRGVHHRQRRLAADVLRDVRLDLPARSVPADRPGLQPAGGRAADPALDRRCRCSSPRSPARCRTASAGVRCWSPGWPCRPSGSAGWPRWPAPPSRTPRWCRPSWSPASGCRCSSRPSPTSCSARCAATRRASPPARTTRSASSAGSSGSPCSARCSRAHGSYASGSAFVAGLTPAVWVGAAAVAVAAGAALLLPRARRATADAPEAGPAQQSPVAGKLEQVG